ncbi:hypothetical protein CLV98_110145 [Dyadobacter jejuensis]|uniref:Uncharacterized protein n=1 Tax=Dyadobacter jejuensis TaxID=1082580 RepID=A0A316AIP3_9BACT|nr:hypothetical protein CLV98_110145 [Dyadobacter jejuensis]
MDGILIISQQFVYILLALMDRPRARLGPKKCKISGTTQS